MDQNQSYYIQVIRDHLLDKQTHNPSYSLRAFARDVNIHPSSLSQILKGKRGLSFKDAAVLQKKLQLDPIEATKFMGSIMRSRALLDTIKIPDGDDRHVIDDTHFQVIAEWEHYTVLDLFDVNGFHCSKEEVSLRLGISVERADEVIENLVESGLLKKTESGFERVFTNIRTTEDVSSRALKASHEETMRMGIDKLHVVPVDERDFSSATYAIDPEKIPEAKAIIREFRMKMRTLLSQGDKRDVYQLAIQFYPMTQTKAHGDIQ